MSETVFYTGTCQPIKFEDTTKTFEENVRKFLTNYAVNLGKDLPDYSDWDYDFDEWFFEFCHDIDCPRTFHIRDGVLYALKNKEHDCDICEARKISNEFITYTLVYYNGGLGFSEALDNALDDVL